jgi:hypothetical protein
MKATSLPVIRPLLLGTCVGLMVIASGGAASAQETPATPPPSPPPPAATGGGNGLGIGAAAFLSGIGGALVNYDEAIWDIEGILSFSDQRTGGSGSPRNTTLEIGARGWYHLHHGSNSDFSVGGGFGVQHSSAGPGSTATLIEPGVRARAFITSNVAIHAMVGLSLVLGDNAANNNNVGIRLGAQPMFGIGFTYYFK